MSMNHLLFYLDLFIWKTQTVHAFNFTCERCQKPAHIDKRSIDNEEGTLWILLTKNMLRNAQPVNVHYHAM